MGSGPEPSCPADKTFQFPEGPVYKDDIQEESEPEFEDDLETDPDWQPTEDDLSQVDEEDDENSLIRVLHAKIHKHDCTEYTESFVLPTINSVWNKQQRSNLEDCRGQNIRVGGDARCCTMGHNAKYGSYTLMDIETGLVLATELVQSNEVKNSNAMELEGLKRALATLDDHDIHVTDITSDRHPQVRKFLREERPEINHWLDSWHVAKCSKAHKELKLLLGNQRLVGDVKKLSPLDQTSELEAHHKVVCQFSPKFVNFSYAAMKERIHLAALHTSCNASRSQAKTQDGEWRYKVSYPKFKGGGHVVQPVMEETSYAYLDVLMEELVGQQKRRSSHKSAEEAAQELYENIPPPLADSCDRVDKHDAVLAHNSRFGIILKGYGHT